MVLTYKECIEKYESDFKLKKAIKDGNIYQKEKGIYSTKENCSDLEIINAKYPKAVFAGESAYFYYSLTDTIPDNYVLATKRTDSRIKDKNVKQIFVNEDIFDFEKKKIEYNGASINIYSRERMLVDLIRFRKKYPFDFYKEIIGNYRNIINELDFYAIEMYAKKFKSQESILDRIQLEVL